MRKLFRERKSTALLVIPTIEGRRFTADNPIPADVYEQARASLARAGAVRPSQRKAGGPDA